MLPAILRRVSWSECTSRRRWLRQDVVAACSVVVGSEHCVLSGPGGRVVGRNQQLPTHSRAGRWRNPGHRWAAPLPPAQSQDYCPGESLCKGLSCASVLVWLLLNLKIFRTFGFFWYCFVAVSVDVEAVLWVWQGHLFSWSFNCWLHCVFTQWLALELYSAIQDSKRLFPNYSWMIFYGILPFKTESVFNVLFLTLLLIRLELLCTHIILYPISSVLIWYLVLFLNNHNICASQHLNDLLWNRIWNLIKRRKSGNLFLIFLLSMHFDNWMQNIS